MSGNDSRKVKRFWDKAFANSEIDYNTHGRRNFSRIIERLQKEGAKRVLDLGCGFGFASIALANEGFRVKAVDISSYAIEKLREQANKDGLAIETEASAAQNITTNEHFDAVIANSVLDHMGIEDAQLSIRNIELILNEGGFAFLSSDGEEEGSTADFSSFPDGTRCYTKGKRKGMLWRFYTNKEIKLLRMNSRLLSFENVPTGEGSVGFAKK